MSPGRATGQKESKVERKIEKKDEKEVFEMDLNKFGETIASVEESQLQTEEAPAAVPSHLNTLISPTVTSKPDEVINENPVVMSNYDQQLKEKLINELANETQGIEPDPAMMDFVPGLKIAEYFDMINLSAQDAERERYSQLLRDKQELEMAVVIQKSREHEMERKRQRDEFEKKEKVEEERKELLMKMIEEEEKEKREKKAIKKSDKKKRKNKETSDGAKINNKPEAIKTMNEEIDNAKREANDEEKPKDVINGSCSLSAKINIKKQGNEISATNAICPSSTNHEIYEKTTDAFVEATLPNPNYNSNTIASNSDQFGVQSEDIAKDRTDEIKQENSIEKIGSVQEIVKAENARELSNKTDAVDTAKSVLTPDKTFHVDSQPKSPNQTTSSMSPKATNYQQRNKNNNREIRSRTWNSASYNNESRNDTKVVQIKKDRKQPGYPQGYQQFIPSPQQQFQTYIQPQPTVNYYRPSVSLQISEPLSELGQSIHNYLSPTWHSVTVLKDSLCKEKPLELNEYENKLFQALIRDHNVHSIECLKQTRFNSSREGFLIFLKKFLSLQNETNFSTVHALCCREIYEGTIKNECQEVCFLTEIMSILTSELSMPEIQTYFSQFTTDKRNIFHYAALTGNACCLLALAPLANNVFLHQKDLNDMTAVDYSILRNENTTIRFLQTCGAPFNFDLPKYVTWNNDATIWTNSGWEYVTAFQRVMNSEMNKWFEQAVGHTMNIGDQFSCLKFARFESGNKFQCQVEFLDQAYIMNKTEGQTQEDSEAPKKNETIILAVVPFCFDRTRNADPEPCLVKLYKEYEGNYTFGQSAKAVKMYSQLAGTSSCPQLQISAPSCPVETFIVSKLVPGDMPFIEVEMGTLVSQMPTILAMQFFKVSYKTSTEISQLNAKNAANLPAPEVQPLQRQGAISGSQMELPQQIPFQAQPYLSQNFYPHPQFVPNFQQFQTPPPVPIQNHNQFYQLPNFSNQQNYINQNMILGPMYNPIMPNILPFQGYTIPPQMYPNQQHIYPPNQNYYRH